MHSDVSIYQENTLIKIILTALFHLEQYKKM